MRVISGLLFLAATCLLMATGCGARDARNRHAVSGTVLLDSKPVAFGSIEFNPLDPLGVQSGAGITDGQFEFPAAKGLPPGEYLIRISAPSEKTVVTEEAPGEMVRASRELIPAEYNTRSQEHRTVVAGERNEFVFEIKTTSQSNSQSKR